MSEIKENINIPGAMEYGKLRDYGLEYIRKIGSQYWTDFNVHDPGVTILEALALSVSDLSYRSSASMSDLLTRAGGRYPSLEGTMFPADRILPNAPTTVEDYRKLILENVPGVRNVWFETVTRSIDVPHIVRKLDAGTEELAGYYNVKVELESLDSILGDKRILSVIGRDIDGSMADHLGSDNYVSLYEHYIRTVLLRHRNLCENFFDIKILSPVRMGICAELEIESDVDVRQILQEIYDRLYDYICPTIPFHTLESLLAEGKAPRDIFSPETPLLGYIDRDELNSLAPVRELYLSDAIGVLMKIDGIRSVRDLHFEVEDDVDGLGRSSELIDVSVDGDHLRILEGADVSLMLTPFFMRNRRISRTFFLNNVIFYRNGLSFFPPEVSGAESPQSFSVKPREDERKALPEGFTTRIPLPRSSYRSTDRYFSFQNLFPVAYRLGPDTLPETASKLRKAERLQLKAYLTFFDQILADYLSQLDHLHDILSVDSGGSGNRTYFHYSLKDTDVVDVSKVLKGYPEYALPQEPEQSELVRKNQILNHLLSRFADTFAEYTALEFIKKGYEDEFSLKECVEDKKRFLSDYPRISSLRSSGIDWTQSGGISGAERRILRKLGVNDPDSCTRISGGDSLGIHILEHSLFAPFSVGVNFMELAREEGEVRLLSDPYSFRVTAVLPGWTELACNLYFRRYVENMVREELPAHIFVKVCWLSRSSMEFLEDAYGNWCAVMKRNSLRKSGPGDAALLVEADNRMVEAFSRFENVYSEAVVVADGVYDFADDDTLTRLDFSYVGSEDVTDTPGTVDSDTPEIEADPEPEPEPEAPIAEGGKEEKETVPSPPEVDGGVKDSIGTIGSALMEGIRNVGSALTDNGPALLGSLIKGVARRKGATDKNNSNQ